MVIIPVFPTLVPSPTCTFDVERTVEEVIKLTVTSAGWSGALKEKSSSGFREEPGEFMIGVGPPVVSKPVGGIWFSRIKVLARQIRVRANSTESVGRPVGLLSSTALGGSALDAMVMILALLESLVSLYKLRGGQPIK